MKEIFICFSFLIIVFKSNRTVGYFCFKIRKPKPNYPSAIDEKNKKFSDFQKRADIKTQTNALPYSNRLPKGLIKPMPCYFSNRAKIFDSE